MTECKSESTEDSRPRFVENPVAEFSDVQSTRLAAPALNETSTEPLSAEEMCILGTSSEAPIKGSAKKNRRSHRGVSSPGSPGRMAGHHMQMAQTLPYFQWMPLPIPLPVYPQPTLPHFVAQDITRDSSSLQDLVRCHCQDILRTAPNNALKAVDMANELRERIGTDKMVFVRDQYGGLLTLLEMHPETFLVERIPKSDRVSLVPNALLFTPPPGALPAVQRGLSGSSLLHIDTTNKKLLLFF